MSRRTAQADKAVRLAWERERGLVQEGKGTRDWTEEQQEDILNPEKGKAYDDTGKAFQGQHMRSVEKHPEYQGNPDNIQFLTRKEHLEAHKGNWQTPCNWYYDPITKEYIDFGDGEIIPCKIIDLSDPTALSKTISDYTKDDNNKEEAQEDAANYNKAPPKKAESKHGDGNIRKNPTVEAASIRSHENIKPPKGEGGFVKAIKGVGRFIVNHPIESLEIAGVVIGGAVELVSSFKGSSSKSSSPHQTSSNKNPSAPKKSDIATKVADIVEKANRTSPSENDVSGHRQRYHTKDGVVWRDKAPYHRGGKDN